MWIFAQKGFLSIVKHREKPGYLLIRARMKGDIEAYFPDAEVEIDAGSDYKYRTILHEYKVADALFDTVMEIDYDNFKDNIADKQRRGFTYARVWALMKGLQDRFNR